MNSLGRITLTTGTSTKAIRGEHLADAHTARVGDPRTVGKGIRYVLFDSKRSNPLFEAPNFQEISSIWRDWGNR